MRAGAMADGFRLLWAQTFWNLRKTWFLLRGRRGPAPCQCDSHDPRHPAFRCAAVTYWESPDRFARRVCPLLQPTPVGWRCRAPAGAAKPFWGLASVWLGGLALALYLTATTGFWGVIRIASDAPVAWWRIAWPGAWSSIAPIQAEANFQKSRAAFNGGDYVAAYRILASARLRDPGNYETALLMAQLSMFQGSYYHADELFAELAERHPQQFHRTMMAYHDVLLCLNRMDRLAEHCLAMVRRDKSQSVLWVRSLLLALRDRYLSRDFQLKHASQIETLPAFARMLVEARLELANGRPDSARARLREVFRGPWNAQYIERHLVLLAELGDIETASTLLGYYSVALGRRETMGQQYMLDQQAGDHAGARASFDALLRTASSQNVMHVVLLLLRHPDGDCYRRLHARLLADPELRLGVDGPTLWITGVLCRVPAEADVWKTPEQVLFGQNYPAVSQFDFKSARINDPASVVHLINVLQLPREVIWELLARMHNTRRVSA